MTTAQELLKRNDLHLTYEDKGTSRADDRVGTLQRLFVTTLSRTAADGTQQSVTHTYRPGQAEAEVILDHDTAHGTRYVGVEWLAFEVVHALLAQAERVLHSGGPDAGPQGWLAWLRLRGVYRDVTAAEDTPENANRWSEEWNREKRETQELLALIGLDELGRWEREIEQ